jgi:Ca-activated chloride channel homolog
VGLIPQDRSGGVERLLHRRSRSEVGVRVIALLFVGCLLSAANVYAQSSQQSTSEPAAPPAATFRSGIDLVALNVVVTDSEQKLIANLAQKDFSVYEDGVQQDVTFFAASHVPLDLALLLDTSASMSDKMSTMQEAAIGFAATLRDGDRISIVDIKETVKVLHPLDGDVDGAREAVRATVARGGTGLYNGLYLTLKDLVKKRRDSGDIRRQAIAVLSDGDDTASLVGFDDVMEVAKQAGVAIYTITLRSDIDIRAASAHGRRYFSNAEYSMKALAQETGARAFFPSAITELNGVYESIAEELANQYALGYMSKNPSRNGAYRRVIVKVPQKPGALTRTRSGYMAARTNASLE